MPAEKLSPGDARNTVGEIFGEIRDGLERLVRIPSVSAAGFEPEQVRRSALATAEWLERLGLRGVRLLDADGAHPAVYGAAPGPPGTPTVLLYAHHDVQPPGSRELWVSPPFEPTERDGRLFGRGTADDKAGIAVHAAVLRAFEGKPPVGVTVFIEGEEEIASVHLPEFLRRYGSLLAADVAVVADCSNWTIGRPALTTTVRGILDCVVEVRVLDHAVHSGMYGGPVPDALTVLSRLIATLHRRGGRVAVRGLRAGPPHAQPVAEGDLRAAGALRPGVRLLGRGALNRRLWSRPAIAVLGIDAPPVAEAAHRLVPAARAKISVRVAPGDQTQRAFRAIERHLRSRAPWGAEVRVRQCRAGEPHRIDASGPAYEAFRHACADTWGRPPVESGTGGSLPPVSALASVFPQMALLLTGVEDPDSRVHSENESVHLSELRNYCTSEALLLSRLAGT